MKLKIGRIGILLAAMFAFAAVSLPGVAAAKDSNKDRIPDRWEKSNKLSLKKDQRKLDQDSDGLKNRGEWLSGTSPRDKDSDDDGIKDSKEKAGVIASYDSEAGTLTISLYAGGEITGSVTDETRVKCQDDESGDTGTGDPGTGDPTTASSHNSGSDDQGSEDEGSEDDSSGDPSEGTGSDDPPEGEGHHGDRGDHGDHGGCNGDCSVDDLAEGVEVTEANVKYTADGKVFTELEIVKVAAAA